MTLQGGKTGQIPALYTDRSKHGGFLDQPAWWIQSVGGGVTGTAKRKASVAWITASASRRLFVCLTNCCILQMSHVAENVEMLEVAQTWAIYYQVAPTS